MRPAQEGHSEAQPYREPLHTGNFDGFAGSLEREFALAAHLVEQCRKAECEGVIPGVRVPASPLYSLFHSRRSAVGMAERPKCQGGVDTGRDIGVVFVDVPFSRCGASLRDGSLGVIERRLELAAVVVKRRRKEVSPLTNGGILRTLAQRPQL